MWTLRPEAWQGPRPPECMPNTTCDKLYLLAHVRDPPRTAWTASPQMSQCWTVVNISWGSWLILKKKGSRRRRKTLNHNEYLCCALLLSRVRLFATPWTVACQAPLSMRILQARILEWVASLNEYLVVLNKKELSYLQVARLSQFFFSSISTKGTKKLSLKR